MLVPPTPPPMITAWAWSIRARSSSASCCQLGAPGALLARVSAGAGAVPPFPAGGTIRQMPAQIPAGPTIDEVIAAIPAWRGHSSRVEPIGGGLTNRNYRVDVDAVPHFVRIPGPATKLLAIDRSNELHNTRAAARAGVGPPVLLHLSPWDVMVLEWLPGRTMSNGAFAAADGAARIARVLKRLH